MLHLGRVSIGSAVGGKLCLTASALRNDVFSYLSAWACDVKRKFPDRRTERYIIRRTTRVGLPNENVVFTIVADLDVGCSSLTAPRMVA